MQGMSDAARSAFSAATGSLALGAETADTAVQLGRSAVGAAGVAGQAALKTAGDAAAAAAAITQNALAATDKISKAALNTGANVAAQGVDTAGKAAVQGLQTAGVAANVVFNTTNNVLGALDGLVNTPLAGLSDYFKKNNIKKQQTEGVKGRDLLVKALVGYYSDKQKAILVKITNLATARLALARKLQKIFVSAHCKKGYLYNTCDNDFREAAGKFTNVQHDIDGQLIETESTIIALTEPLEADLYVALGEDIIDIANPSDMAKLTKIFTEKTAPHSAQIATFFTMMNALCNEATEVFARKKSSAIPPSLPTHPVQMGVAPNIRGPKNTVTLEQRLANLKLPNANMQIPNPIMQPQEQPVGGRRRTTRTKRHRLRKTRNSRPIRRSKTVHRKQRRTRRS